jgi:Aerobic-type carbon monoxide dehydrogenase, large subunit CoxL/CutL homologs
VTAANQATPGAPPVRDHSASRRWVGQSIRRVEDPKFLLGRGGYIADRITPGTLHAAVLRSPLPTPGSAGSRPPRPWPRRGCTR